jgi:hypothetical protein
MADIFISHSSKTPDNLRKVGRLSELLSSRWSVWWDDALVGKYSQVIPEEVRRAKCMVPVWTYASHSSDSVQDELALAKKFNAQIVPVSMEQCDAPFGYGTYSKVDFTNWNGEPNHPAVLQLVRKLESVVQSTNKPRQPRKVFGDRLELPALFMSVSSHETQLAPLPGVQALRIFGAKAVLVSAYDLLPGRRAPKMAAELQKIRNQGGLVLIDSGNYEASRLDDKSWKPQQFKCALDGIPHDLAFSFDVMEPSKGPKEAARQIVEAVTRDSQFTAAPILPIVHAPYSEKQKGYVLHTIPAVIRSLSEQLAPPLIAVPERELGHGLVERAQTVQRIRQELDTLPFYQPLHLLGTGNPWSIAVLAAAGADSFDGLEWCRVAVDREANRLNHFQHFDLFTYQIGWADSPLLANLLGNDNIDFNAKAAFHNLDYFTQLGKDIRSAAAKGSFEAFVASILGSSYKLLAKKMPSLFP